MNSYSDELGLQLSDGQFVLRWKASLIPQKTKGFSFEFVLLRNFVSRSRLPEAFEKI